MYPNQLVSSAFIQDRVDAFLKIGNILGQLGLKLDDNFKQLYIVPHVCGELGNSL